MRLITMHKRLGEANLEFYGCPLGCRFCAHKSREKKDYSYDQVMKFLAEYETKKVFLGGGEPALHKRELAGLIKVLSKRGKEVTLKTVGSDPDFLRDTLGSVHRYILEINAPLDDLDAVMRLTNLDESGARSYLEQLGRSVEVLKGQRVRVMVRAIPTIMDRARTERLGAQLEGRVDELQLVQFMGGGYDLPFEGTHRPAPPFEEMEALGRIMLAHVPLVVLQGDGFGTTLRR